MEFVDWLSGYKPWVLLISSLLVVTSALLLIIYSPNSERNISKELDERIGSDVLASFGADGCTVVVGAYYDKHIAMFEASALIGTGDALALGAVMTSTHNLGLEGCKVQPSRNFPGNRLGGNLVLIGGPDSNEVTRQVLEKLHLRTKFGDADRHEIQIRDSSSEITYVPTRNADGALSNDYGVLIRTSNPFNSNRRVVIIAGSFGHGTHAAAQLLLDSELEESIPQSSSNQNFEVLVETEIVNDWPQTPRIIYSSGI